MALRTDLLVRSVAKRAVFLLGAGCAALSLASNEPCTNAGTRGRALPAVQGQMPACSIVLLGEVAPVNAASPGYLAEAVREVNLLRPAAVFTLGNMVPGETRSEQRYQEEVESLRRSLDVLKMPWYPCVGYADVVSGTRDPQDLRFERLYQQKLGPLYYSVDLGRPAEGAVSAAAPVHVIVLDSEEVLPDNSRGISDEQRAWLRADLRRTFDRWSEDTTVTPPSVLVLLHRALWESPYDGNAESPQLPAGWAAVHRVLVQFNERPIVSVEGDGLPANASAVRSGPRVLAVYAATNGVRAAFAKDLTRDGIRYTRLGPTAARMDQDASVEIRHFTLLQVNPAAEDPLHAAVVKLTDAERGGAILPDDVVTAQEREILDRIASLSNSAMGVEGMLDASALGRAAAGEKASPSPLTLHVSNPLKVPLDIAIRLASAQNLGTATARENANPYTENFDAPWQLDTLHQIRHLAPGASESWPITLTWGGSSGAETNGGVPPPQVEFLVHWLDPRQRGDGGAGSEAGGAGRGAGGPEGGQVKDVLLKRRIPVAPYAEVPTLPHVDAGDERSWLRAVQGEAYAWEVQEGELSQRNPEWQMVADADRVYLRVRVEDGTRSYSQDTRLDWKWGGPASDAVALAWVPSTGRGEAGKGGGLRRLWIIPFAPHGPELWENEGVGEQQTALVRAPESLRVSTSVATRADGYTLTVALPRELLAPTEASAAAEGGGIAEVRFNMTVYNNDDGAMTFRRSWAPEGLGTAGWGRLRVRPLEIQPTTSPQ